MKTKLNVQLPLVLLLVLVLSSVAYAIPVSLDIQDDFIITGETFSVGVSVNAADPSYGNLTGFGFNIDLAADALFTYDGFELGAGFVLPNMTVSDVEGALSANYSNAGQDIIQLATLSFIAGDISGTDQFGVEGLLDPFFGIFMNSGLGYQAFGENGSLIFHDAEISYTDATITIHDSSAPVPEPATILLLGTGLAGLLGIRRKKATR